RRGPAPAPARSAPTGFSPHDRQLDRLRLDRLGQLRDLRPCRLQLPIAWRARSSRFACQRGQGGVLDRAPYPDHRRYVDVPLAGGLGLADLARGHLQEDLPLGLRGQLGRTATAIGIGHERLLGGPPRRLPALGNFSPRSLRRSQTPTTSSWLMARFRARSGWSRL